MLYFVHYENLPDQGIEPLGLICILLNVVTIGAPLFSIGEVQAAFEQLVSRWYANERLRVCHYHCALPVSW